ncbi:Uncharacterised protein [Mycobacteroides abscessus]|nr:Uncharacterised protein [Mycobacteroides abscessus]
MLGLEVAGELVRDGGDGRRVLLAVERGVQVDALGPARHGQGFEAHALEDLPRLACDLRALGQPGPRAGVEVEDEAVGVEVGPGATELPLRHVELERRRLAEPREGRKVVDQHVVVGAALVLDAPRAHPGRDALARVLLEEHLAVDAVGPPLARRGPVGAVGEHDVGDGREVREDVGLRRAGGGVEDLVQVGEAQAVTTDVHRLARPAGCGGHGPIVARARRRRPPWRELLGALDRGHWVGLPDRPGSPPGVDAGPRGSP